MIDDLITQARDLSNIEGAGDQDEAQQEADNLKEMHDVLFGAKFGFGFGCKEVEEL